jgi:hypothetical protein
MCAPATRRKLLTVDASDFMFLSVVGVMGDSVDTRMGNRVTGLEYVANVSHLFSFAREAHSERTNRKHWFLVWEWPESGNPRRSDFVTTLM